MSGDVVSPVLIGRGEELEVLAAALDRALAGETGFVLLGGEAGVGKTRLLRELSARAEDAGFGVLSGQCVEPGAEGLPFAPLVDVLRTLARTMPPDQLGRVLGRPRPPCPGCCPSSLRKPSRRDWPAKPRRRHSFSSSSSGCSVG
jgi:hypothetical protein